MEKVPNLVCLETSPEDIEILSELLTEAYFNIKIDCTETNVRFVSLLKSNHYDIILSDFKLPGFDGFVALQLTLNISPEVPFSCVSGSVGESQVKEKDYGMQESRFGKAKTTIY